MATSILSKKTLSRFKNLSEQDLEMIFEFLFLLDDLENGATIKAADEQYLSLLKEEKSNCNQTYQIKMTQLLQNFSYSKQ